MAEDEPIKLVHDPPIKLDHAPSLSKKANRAPALAPAGGGGAGKKHQPVPAPAVVVPDAAAGLAKVAEQAMADVGAKAGTAAKKFMGYAKKKRRELVTPKQHERSPRAHKTGGGRTSGDKYVHAKRLRSARHKLFDEGLWVGLLGVAVALTLLLGLFCRRRCKRRSKKTVLPLRGTASSPLSKGKKATGGFFAAKAPAAEALPAAVKQACRANRVAVVDDWLRSCASPDARDAEPPRRAATHVAATHGAAAACRALLHGGADPNLVDDAGDAPLHLAAAFGSGAVVKILLDHGADPSLRDALGHDAKERAVANANTGCALLISKRLSAGGEARGAAARRKLKAEP